MLTRECIYEIEKILTDESSVDARRAHSEQQWKGVCLDDVRMVCALARVAVD